MKFERLGWEEGVAEHIWDGHRLTVEDVEDAFENRFADAPTYGKRVLFFGRTNDGRYVTIVVARWSGAVVTARPMSKREKKRYK